MTGGHEGEQGVGRQPRWEIIVCDHCGSNTADNWRCAHGLCSRDENEEVVKPSGHLVEVMPVAEHDSLLDSLRLEVERLRELEGRIMNPARDTADRLEALLPALQEARTEPSGACGTCADTRWLCDECGEPKPTCVHGGDLSQSGCPDCRDQPDHPVNQPPHPLTVGRVPDCQPEPSGEPEPKLSTHCERGHHVLCEGHAGIRRRCSCRCHPDSQPEPSGEEGR